MEKNIVCPLCGRTFRRTSNMKQHYWFAHPKPVCIICGKKFSSRQSLMRHSRMMIERYNDDKHKLMLWLSISGKAASLKPSTRASVDDGKELALHVLSEDR